MKILISFLFVCSSVSAQTLCSCHETTQESHQERSQIKHVTDFKPFKIKSKSITPEFMYKWQHRYSSKTDQISVAPNSPHEHGTPEDTLYVLRGYLWMVKIEDNDCDFHMEIGPHDGSKTRMIVEVPKENKTVQEKIKKHLESLGYTINGCPEKKDSHLSKGIPIIIKGVGFYDASHKPNTNHGDEHTKIYSWELHPVKDVIFP